MSTHETHTPPENRSVASLLSDLAGEVTTLMRQELQLAKAEASEKVSQVEAGIGSLIAGGAVVFGGFLILLQFMVYGLADLLDEGYDIPQLWVSSLIVGLVTLLIGYFLLRKGQRDLKAKRLVPRRTAGSLRRDAELAKKEVHESRSRYHETY